MEYRRARDLFEKQLQAYWSEIKAKRQVRREKRLTGRGYAAEDYVSLHPPKYSGSELPAEIVKIISQLEPPQPERLLPTVSDFLANATSQYGFVPASATEREFKRKYALEALAIGLTKDQVLRIYALETGGDGTYDMQAGFHPVTKEGKAISSALGYAQLLTANSVNELVKHGDKFAKRLTVLAGATGTSVERAAALRAKAAVVLQMLSNTWSAHVEVARTPAGLGIHTLNLDADVGPWLQVLKLKGLKDAGAAGGRVNLTGAEIELLNLAGPGTGLEMLTPLAQHVPTSNFFSEAGYCSNSIVREKTAAELLKALNDRMEVNMKKPGAIEFAQIFEEVARR